MNYWKRNIDIKEPFRLHHENLLFKVNDRKNWTKLAYIYPISMNNR
jgi:hypothetical protein